MAPAAETPPVAPAAETPPVAPAAEPPPVRAERPYLDFARPRAKGAVAAAAEDELLGRWNVGGSSDPGLVSNRVGFHPGTRVKVDTRVVSGKLPKRAPFDRRTGKHKVVLSETSLLARSRKHGYWPFRLCFEDAVRERGPLKGGKTVLRAWVGPGGRIGSTRVVSTKLDPAVAACLEQRASSIELLPPPRRVEVELSVEVWPGDVPLPSLPPAPKDAASFDADALLVAARKLEPEVAACYAEGLARDPALWGRVQLHVELGSDAKVRAVRENESRFPDRGVTRCVLDRAKHLTFAKSRGTAPAFELAFRLGRFPASDPSIR